MKINGVQKILLDTPADESQAKHILRLYRRILDLEAEAIQLRARLQPISTRVERGKAIQV